MIRPGRQVLARWFRVWANTLGGWRLHKEKALDTNVHESYTDHISVNHAVVYVNAKRVLYAWVDMGRS